MSERLYDVLVAFSSKKQSAFDTPVADIDLTLAHLFKGLDAAELTPEIVTDDEDVGHGEFQTRGEVDYWDTRKSFRGDCTSLMAGWMGAFGLGAVASVDNLDTSYTHTITLNTASHQNPYTTIVERLATGVKRNYPDLCVARFALSGEGKGRAAMELDMVGSGRYADSTLSMPSLDTGGSFLKMSGLKFEIGPTASEVDVSDRLRSWRWALDNDLQEDDGYYPNGGQYRGRIEYGRRKQELSFSLLLNTADQELTDLEAHNYLKCIVTCTGTLIAGANYHQFELTIPKLAYRTVRGAADGDFLLFEIEADIFDDQSTYPVQLEVINMQADYLTT